MKHPSSRQFFGYWDAQRGGERAPDRGAIEPGAVRELLGDIFVLNYDCVAGFPFRVAGTRVCALFGRDIKGAGICGLFAEASRHDIRHVIEVVAEDVVPVIAGVAAATIGGPSAHLELLLLPFAARPHAPLSLTGLLAPLYGAPGRLGPLRLTSWRTLSQPRRTRALRKWTAAHGLTVYEGHR